MSETLYMRISTQNRETDRQTDRQRQTEAERDIDRQTDRQRHREKEDGGSSRQGDSKKQQLKTTNKRMEEDVAPRFRPEV